jgi:hypothetical protein
MLIIALELGQSDQRPLANERLPAAQTDPLDVSNPEKSTAMCQIK